MISLTYIVMLFSFVKCYLIIPFNISDRKDEHKRDIPFHSFYTVLNTKNYGYKKFGISFSTYVTWECINTYSVQNNKNNSIYFSTSQGIVRGNAESNVFNYKNISLPLNVFQVTQSNDACFWFRKSYDLEGEIGLNIADLKESKLNNFSFVEQLSEHELFDKDQKFTLVFNDKTHQPNKGILLFGNNKHFINNNLPLITLEIEHSYIKSSTSFLETIYFQNGLHKQSNNIYIHKRVIFTYENKITFIPENYYQSFMNLFIEHLIHKYNDTLSFNYLCKVQQINMFSNYLSCRKDILEYFDMPFIVFGFSDKKEIILSLNEMFYENKDSLIFGIGFNVNSNSVILGMNFFNKFISEYNVKNMLLTLYEVNNNNILKIFTNKNSISNSRLLCYCCILLLIISSLFLIMFTSVNLCANKSSINIKNIKLDKYGYNYIYYN